MGSKLLSVIVFFQLLAFNGYAHNDSTTTWCLQGVKSDYDITYSNAGGSLSINVINGRLSSIKIKDCEIRFYEGKILIWDLNDKLEWHWISVDSLFSDFIEKGYGRKTGGFTYGGGCMGKSFTLADTNTLRIVNYKFVDQYRQIAVVKIYFSSGKVSSIEIKSPSQEFETEDSGYYPVQFPIMYIRLSDKLKVSTVNVKRYYISDILKLKNKWHIGGMPYKLGRKKKSVCLELDPMYLDSIE